MSANSVPDGRRARTVNVRVERLSDLPPDATATMVAESDREGWRFVRRLADDWAAGTNRFDRPGEAFSSREPTFPIP